MDVWVGVGSNLASEIGPPQEVVRRALAELETLSGHDFSRSPLFCSTPVDCPPGSPDFVNAVVRMDVEDRIRPEDFLKSLQAMEKHFGRVRDGNRNAARTLDLDLICWGRLILDQPELRLPIPVLTNAPLSLHRWQRSMPTSDCPVLIAPLLSSCHRLSAMSESSA